MGRKYSRNGLPLILGLLAGLMFAAPAAAEQITASTITAPASGAELFYDGDSGSGAVTVRGVVTGANGHSKGDLWCYSGSDKSHEKNPLATGIDVSSGSFAASVSLAPIVGQACRLALVASGTIPLGAAAARFAGPAISVSDRFSESSGGNLYGYDILGGTLPWSFEFGSIGQCPVVASFATDPTSLTSYSLFSGDACLPETSGVGPAAGTRSALQIDGLNAYPPGAISSLTGRAGFEPLSYAASFDPGDDAGTIVETELPMVCDAPGGYPPSISSCPSLHLAGIEITQYTTLLAGGQITRVTQRLTSVDGRAHSLDVLFGQSVHATITGAQPGFAFPGQSSIATHAAPDSFSAFSAGANSILVVGSAAASAGTLDPAGAITYARPPLRADFVSSAGSTATLLMHYADLLSPTGTVAYDWSFSEAASASGLFGLERVERDRFAAPAISIDAPRNRLTTSRGQLPVRGRVFDQVGIAAVSVNGRGVALGAGNTFSTLVDLHPGANLITATVINEAGLRRSSTVTVLYKPTPCRVPRLQGRTLAAARRALAAADCAVGTIRRVRSSAVGRGRILSSSPQGGSTHRPGTKVALVVSRGR